MSMIFFRTPPANPLCLNNFNDLQSGTGNDGDACFIQDNVFVGSFCCSHCTQSLNGEIKLSVGNFSVAV